ncbi:MAG: hypothetical protein C6W57_16875 [Caldibacillus debilis]|nr:MAG: hypothetical protein C6W57_16875 [Caldibacillus debilis]
MSTEKGGFPACFDAGEAGSLRRPGVFLPVHGPAAGRNPDPGDRSRKIPPSGTMEKGAFVRSQGACRERHFPRLLQFQKQKLPENSVMIAFFGEFFIFWYVDMFSSFYL